MTDKQRNLLVTLSIPPVLLQATNRAVASARINGLVVPAVTQRYTSYLRHLYPSGIAEPLRAHDKPYDASGFPMSLRDATRLIEIATTRRQPADRPF